MNGKKLSTWENLIPSLGIGGTAEDIASQTWLTRRKSHKKGTRRTKPDNRSGAGELPTLSYLYISQMNK
jgi:hypothetical protein